MKQFVAQHLKYPVTAIKARVEGTVTVRYSLDYRGKVVDAKIKKGLGHGCDEEAMRVVRLMRFEVPQDRKKKVRIHQDIHIHFNLPPPKEARATSKSNIAVNYSSKPQKKQQESPGSPPANPGSYTYTIKW